MCPYTRIHNNHKKLLLDSLIKAAYDHYDEEFNKLILDIGTGKEFHYRGEMYRPYGIPTLRTNLTMAQRDDFAIGLQEYRLVEAERKEVKQHFINYFNVCNNLTDLYQIVPSYLDFYMESYEPPTLHQRIIDYYVKCETMELYLDRLFLARLE